MIYEYDATQWSRGEAWRHLWGCYLLSAEYVPRKNPFRKCHLWLEWYDEVGAWRWEGPELTPGPACSFALVRCNPCPKFQHCWDESQAAKR